MTAVPKGCMLNENIDAAILAAADYEHITVGDLCKFLAECPQDAPLWCVTGYADDPWRPIVKPLEEIFGDNGNIFVG